MRLALAHCSSPSDISGVTTWFEKLVVRLHNDGVELFVHLHHFGENPESASILPAFNEAGVPVEVVKRGRTLEIDIRKTLGFLDRVQPTIFLPQCLNAHFYAAAIAGRQGLPWALTIHSDDPDYWAIANECRPPVNGGKSVSVSEHIARLVIERDIDWDSVVIPYGVNIPAQVAKYRNKPFRVVYSGRLVETQKRVSLVVATLIRACEINPDIVATIIGEGPERGACQKKISDAGLTERIKITGRLAPEKVKDELLDAQAILLMSDFEGLPVALLEALAVGVVPVARAISSGIPELVHNECTGLLVNDQPEVAAKALSRIADDRTLWQNSSLAARQLVSELYSEDMCYQRWLSFIESLNNQSSVHYPLKVPDRLDLSIPASMLNAGYPLSRAWYLRFAAKLDRILHAISR